MKRHVSLSFKVFILCGIIVSCNSPTVCDKISCALNSEGFSFETEQYDDNFCKFVVYPDNVSFYVSYNQDAAYKLRKELNEAAVYKFEKIFLVISHKDQAINDFLNIRRAISKNFSDDQ